MKNKIILSTILIMGIMGTSLYLQAAGSGLDLLWTWNGTKVESLFIDGNKAYIGSHQRFIILGLSTEFAPIILGEMPMTAHVPAIYVSGKYAYVVDSVAQYSWPSPNTGLRIIDISIPYNPRQVGFYTNYSPEYEPIFQSIFVSGKLAYIGTIRSGFHGSWGTLEILDISNLAFPKLKGSLSSLAINDIHVSGNYAYCSFVDQGGVWSWGGLLLIDISNPGTPLEKSFINYGASRWSNSVYFANGYVYMASYENAGHGPLGSFEIIDVTNPVDLKRQFSYRTKGTARDAYLAGNFAFIADGKAGVSVLNISDLNEIVEVAYYETPGEATKVFVNDLVYVVDDSAGLLIFKITTPLIKLNKLKLDKTALKFGATQNISTPAQDVWVHNEGLGTLHWNATSDAGWLTVSPQAGEGNGTMSVKVNPGGLSAGIYDGIVTITDPQVYNGPQEVNVTLKVFPNESVPPPCGCIDTPIDGSSVMNNIPVTGWALHDMGVKSVKIYREDGWDEGKTPVCIGNAFFLAGSRPDIETAYSDYPSSEKSGWGYMVLTNLFPGGGNGLFTIHAVAQTLDGQQVTLGSKKIICDNVHSVIPFGDINTPRQGRAVPGGWFENSAWVLTPLPNSIPIDGSTIYVFVDGVKVGHPIYNLASPAVAKLFPGYANSESARGYFDLHTADYEEGLHTIQWVAIDSNRNMGGIGCRYFSIQGSVNSRERGANNALTKNSKMICDLDRIPGNYMDPIKIEKGFKSEAVDADDCEIFPGTDGICKVEIKELEHIEIQLGENITDIQGYLLINNQLRPLPIGSTFDAKAGKFYWSPGPGYFGRYELVFVIKDVDNRYYKKGIEINIKPLFNMKRRQPVSG